MCAGGSGGRNADAHGLDGAHGFILIEQIQLFSRISACLSILSPCLTHALPATEPQMYAQIVFYTELAFNILNGGSFD